MGSGAQAGDGSGGQEGHVGGWGSAYHHCCRQLACPLPFCSLGSSEAAGSQDKGAVSPQTTMMPRAYHEDRHQPWDPGSFTAELERALESPRAPLVPGTLHSCLAALPAQPQPGPLLGESKLSSPHGDLELA